MSKIRDQVKAFHEKFGIEDPVVPTVPDISVLRLRLAMLFEEYTELCEAAGLKSMVFDEHMAEIWGYDFDPKDFDMVEVVDALGDIDYLSEGFRLTLGVDGDTIADEIQRTNMAKEGGKKDPTGKIRKPPGWQGPKIRECLIAQGWVPPQEKEKQNENV